MLKKAKTRLLTRAAQNRDCVFRGAYRAATVREPVPYGTFQQPAREVDEPLDLGPQGHACVLDEVCTGMNKGDTRKPG
jgi:hypothetical protein